MWTFAHTHTTHSERKRKMYNNKSADNACLKKTRERESRQCENRFLKKQKDTFQKYEEEDGLEDLEHLFSSSYFSSYYLFLPLFFSLHVQT